MIAGTRRCQPVHGHPARHQQGGKKPEGDRLVGLASGDLAIGRTKFGIGRDEWKDTGIVADAAAIHIEVVARRKK